jgi:hypothetical protein
MDLHRRYRIKYRTVEALKNLLKRACPPSRVTNADFPHLAEPGVAHAALPDLMQQLVAIQPMNLPRADVFYMDFVAGPVDRRGVYNGQGI